MAANFIAKAEIIIDAPAHQVWKALTTPELIKKYLSGTEAASDWKVGSPIEFKGAYQGKSYHDKGTVLQNLPEKLFQYTYFSSMSGSEDKPENYLNVSYELNEEDGKTILTIKNENLADEEARSHAEQNWKVIAEKIKDMVENKKEGVLK